MELFIKNMVSIRCKMAVKSVLDTFGLGCTRVEIGRAEISENPTEEKLNQLNATLLKYGFELLEDRKAILVEKIKNIVVEMIHYSEEQPKVKFSIYLSEKLNYNYTYLSNIFSKVKGTTIEHFILSHKIERAKEMLAYNEFKLADIARKLHYSSIPHLSNQFKNITGHTSSHFKRMKQKGLIPLDNL
jgi:AraC-like DNA-binding protein